MACSWSLDSTKVATAGADGIVTICKSACPRSVDVLTITRGRIIPQIDPDLLHRLGYSFPTERHRLRQSQYHSIRVPLGRHQRFRFSRIIIVQMANSAWPDQSHHCFRVIGRDFLCRLIRRHNEKFRGGYVSWGKGRDMCRSRRNWA